MQTMTLNVADHLTKNANYSSIEGASLNAHAEKVSQTVQTHSNISTRVAKNQRNTELRITHQQV